MQQGGHTEITTTARIVPRSSPHQHTRPAAARHSVEARDSDRTVVKVCALGPSLYYCSGAAAFHCGPSTESISIVCPSLARRRRSTVVLGAIAIKLS